jgi:hypothetical protein
MARNTTDFAQHNTERAVQATNWMRTIAEQNLNQSKAALEGLLTFTRNALRSVDQQSSAICDHSIAVAEQTLSNSFDFARKVIRVKEPQELAQILIGDQTKELGQRMTQGVQEVAKATQEGTEESRRRSEAA